MEKLNDPKSILVHFQQLLQQIKRLATFAYSESNAFALTLLNRKRMELEESLLEQVPDIEPPQQLHKSRTLKAILLCYQPQLRRKLKAMHRSLETYYRDGLTGLQNEVEALIMLITPRVLKIQANG